jgi:hypothetical protein
MIDPHGAMGRYLALCCLAICLVALPPRAMALEVGFGESDITPPLDTGRPVYLAGYGHNRPAEGVHDPLLARAVVLRHHNDKLALVSVDLVGLQYPAVLRIREKLGDYKFVVVSSTHNHEGPDVIGIWGGTPVTSGYDAKYIDLVVDRVVAAVRAAEGSLSSAMARYGTAENETLLGDSRLPKVYDGVLRTLAFHRAEGGRLLGLLVQWNCHPESMGSRNKLITADFPYATVATLKEQYGVPVAYFTGTVGGLMAPPDDVIKDAHGQVLREGDFRYTEAYGRAVAGLAGQAIDKAEPITLAPFAVSARPIAVPLANPYYRLAQSLGVLPRAGRKWTGNFEQLGEVLEVASPDTPGAVETEVAYLRLGELHVACIPGEIYPELVYGKYQNPLDPGADFPDAPLEKSVMEILPGKKVLLLGLANDEIGYIIPKRQWDQLPPFAYGRQKAQYGEINSVGPEAAPILMQALENRVRDAGR